MSGEKWCLLAAFCESPLVVVGLSCGKIGGIGAESYLKRSFRVENGIGGFLLFTVDGVVSSRIEVGKGVKR